VVENRPGASNTIAADLTAKATPDGHTLLVATNTGQAIAPHLMKLSFDPIKDLTPIGLIVTVPNVLVVSTSVPANTVKDLVALMKAKPNDFKYASSGVGSTQHIAGEGFNLAAGVKSIHIPYKGSAPAMTDVLGGQVPLMFSDAPTALPFIRNGKVKALAVASTQRYSLLPDLPTMAESGLPGYEAYSWAAVVAPAGTPKDIVNQVSKDIVKVLSLAETRQRFHEAGADPFPTTPEAFAKILRSEIEKWQRVVKTANIQAD